jgi:hypothetical protein
LLGTVRVCLGSAWVCWRLHLTLTRLSLTVLPIATVLLLRVIALLAVLVVLGVLLLARRLLLLLLLTSWDERLVSARFELESARIVDLL